MAACMCKEFVNSVRDCIRCGDPHENLVFRVLKKPHQLWTHKARCPNGGGPIFLVVDHGEEELD